MNSKKPDGTRGMIAFIFVIILGLIIGKFLKNVKIGLIIGLALGFLGSGMLRRR